MANLQHSPLVGELMSAAAVRERCVELLAVADEDRLSHFRIERRALETVANQVSTLTLQRFPSLDIPFHSRWRHFQAAGQNLWTPMVSGLSTGERLRAAFDLVVVSVLLDAGAGAAWHYLEPHTGQRIGRSEGLALASLRMFEAGTFSSDPQQPLRADAAALCRLDLPTLAAGMQASADNPLIGLQGRLALLNRLGQVLQARPEVFGTDPPRVAGLADCIAGGQADAPVAAARILEWVLHCLGDIWPGRHHLDGVNLGDTWRHPAIARDDASSGLVPFHKLSQWLSYSLVEPLLDAGVTVTELNGLTGLAEYRNGGLFLDLGVLIPRDPTLLGSQHAVDSEVVVEWRALTVALLDELAPLVRAQLGQDAVSLPLAKVLEGGTWSAGREIARTQRADGGPALRVISDGTVF